MTYNIHQLIHIPESVFNFGPLQCHSAFAFESQNYYLKLGIHSANGVPQQAVRYDNVARTIETLKKHVLPDAHRHVKMLFDDMSGITITRYIKVEENIYFGCPETIDDDSLSSLGISDESEFFLRMVKDDCLYVSKMKGHAIALR